MAGLLKVFKNTASLSVLQGVYIITPLVVIPFLVESFGLKGYGELAYVITVLAMFKVVIDYSFELTATKTISLYNKSAYETKLQEKVSLVISTKLTLCVVLFPFYFIISSLILGVSVSYIIVSYCTLITDVFFINWFFQGLQKSAVLLFFRVLSRSMFVILLVLFLDKGSSVYQYFIFEAISSIASVVLLFFYIKKSKKISIFNFIFDKNLLLIELKTGFDIFISKVCVTGYGTVNLLFLGGVVSKEIFAIYTIAEKVFNSLKMISSQFGNALIPYLANTSNDKVFNDKSSLVKITLINQAFLFTSSLGLLIFGDYVVSWISGAENGLQKELVIIFALTLLLSIGPVFTAILIGQGREYVVRQITIKVMVINLILLLPTVHFYGAKGLAILVLINTIYQFFLQIKSQCSYTL